MKKIATVILSTVIFALCLSSCDKNSEDKTNKINPEIMNGLISDIYKTEEQTNMTSKYFDIVVDKGMVISDKAPELFDYIAEEVMNITGLDFYDDEECTNDRITIYIQKESPPYTNDSHTIYLNEMDAIPTSGYSFRAAHEMAHCMQFRHAFFVNHMLNEGYAVSCHEKYISTSQIPCIYYFGRNLANYEIPDDDTLIESIKNSFIFNVPDSSQNVPLPTTEDYALGKRMIKFINDKYGMDAVNKIYKQLSEEKNVNGESILNALYKYTSENVFDDLRKWCDDNYELLTKTVPSIDYSQFDTIYPFYYQELIWGEKISYKYFYYPIGGKINDQLMLDYTYANKYFELAENRECPENYCFDFISDKPCTLTMYDENMNIIKSIKMNAMELRNLTEKTFSYMKIEGECTFFIDVRFEEFIPEELCYHFPT